MEGATGDLGSNRDHASSEIQRRTIVRGLVATGLGGLGLGSVTSIVGCSSTSDGARSDGDRQTSSEDGELSTPASSTGADASGATQSPTGRAPFVDTPSGLAQTDNSGRVYALNDGVLTRYSLVSTSSEASSEADFVWESTGRDEVRWDYEHMVALGFGVLIGRRTNGDLHWHRDLSLGSDAFDWSASGGIKIAEGWQLRHLVALHSGHILAVDPTGEVWWHQWLGDRWHPASGSLLVASDWDFDQACGGGGVVYATRDGQLGAYEVRLPRYAPPMAAPDLGAIERTMLGPAAPNPDGRMFSTGNGHVFGRIGSGWGLWATGVDGRAEVDGLPVDDGTIIASAAGADLGVLQTSKDESTAAVDGYWDHMSVPASRAGVGLALSCASEPTVSFVHLPTQQIVGEPTTFLSELETVPPHAWRDGCDWGVGFMDLPPDLGSDLYAARVEIDSDLLWIPRVVRPPKEPQDAAQPRPSLLVLANTNTWNAYNDWGGISQYTNPFAAQLSFQRPNRLLDPGAVLGPDLDAPNHHLVAGEVEMLTWLHQEGVEYDICSDLDLHDAEVVLDNYSALLLHSHPEYWTVEMFDAVAAWLDRGGKLVNLGGNCVYERVTYTDDRTAMILRAGRVEGIRDLMRFSDRFERSLLGAAFEGVLHEGDLPPLQKSSAAGFFAPYRVVDAQHRFFQGSGLQSGDLFVTEDGVTGGAGWELDTSYFDGHPASAGPAPDNVQLLARGTLGERAGEVGLWTPDYNAHMTYYDHPGGGWVFSAGSLVFTHWMVRDSDAQHVVRNALIEAIA